MSGKPPSVTEIIDFLDEGCGDFCVWAATGERTMPEEIWLPGLACWLRADASSYNFDITHNFARFYPGRFNRWRLRRAIRRFRAMVDSFPQRLAA